ncbi:geranylgeranylglycerol-phosphate geranylgeranyltransferase [Psychroserpens ponticola]|uniref:Geranylgeranylglycerol-phosphate geranylgeranyltransferase n=1 Tax=Psychroserpens ponticola TaxID=2932268 RepID=A0ABY7S0B4_9FLAO|nr:geranylgeranylglycerol-phosphate geranylgeranyltransferase [Psychroserpens ponticola]WCO02830.1 geranylgeranylglycerol-phosphate geranylgeranyltransferase [Psychroserpens ponticola]
MPILNLIRYKNLLLIIVVQLLIRFALFEPFQIDVKLNLLGYSLLILATICIAAAGNIINDIYDIETDTVNKPDKLIIGKSISEKTAFNLYITLNLIGVGLGFYLSHSVGKSAFFSIFVIISAALYVYASFLKQTPVIGNIVISLLVAMSILIVGIFDLLPAITEDNKTTQITFFRILVDYAVFAFLINLVREMIKDIEDIDGDYNAQMNTLPIVIGRERANYIAIAVSLLPIIAVIYFIVTYLYKQQIAIGYFLTFILAPLIYATIKLYNATSKKHYHYISTTYKVIMLLGMLSLLLYPFILK